jgi:hypothetical protein
MSLLCICHHRIACTNTKLIKNTAMKFIVALGTVFAAIAFSTMVASTTSDLVKEQENVLVKIVLLLTGTTVSTGGAFYGATLAFKQFE